MFAPWRRSADLEGGGQLRTCGAFPAVRPAFSLSTLLFDDESLTGLTERDAKRHVTRALGALIDTDVLPLLWPEVAASRVAAFRVVLETTLGGGVPHEREVAIVRTCIVPECRRTERADQLALLSRSACG